MFFYFVNITGGCPTPSGIEYTEFTFVNSNRSANVIQAVDGHQYTLQHTNSKKGISTWRCRKRKGGCTVFVKSHGNYIVRQVHEHNHDVL